MILLDTNILIEVLKNSQSTINKVKTFTPPLSISSITAMELFYGARSKQESRRLERFTALFSTIHLDPAISNRALVLVKQYVQSHSLDIPDSLIAATAIENRAKLFTYNIKDFQFISGLEII